MFGLCTYCTVARRGGFGDSELSAQLIGPLAQEEEYDKLCTAQHMRVRLMHAQPLVRLGAVSGC